jgi:hypothetical protein
MDRYTAFTFVMTLGLGLATGAYALDRPSDTALPAAVGNDNSVLEEPTGTGETPALDERTLSEMMFENVLNREIINIDGEYFIVKDTAGKEVRIIVDGDTLLADGVEDRDAFKTGDTIEAELAPNLGQRGDRTTTQVTTEDYPHAKSFRVIGTGLENSHPQ